MTGANKAKEKFAPSDRAAASGGPAEGAAAPQDGRPQDGKRLTELKDRAAAIRKELEAVEAEIEKEQALLSDEAPKMLHHRPSWSILGGAEAEAEDAVPSIRELSPEDHDFTSVIKDHPELKIEPILAFNHWDRRECAVTNGAEWQARCERYMKDLGGAAEIPKVIHQIWIGPREPPCLWIDTFRVDYCEANPGWGFEMWSDEQVAKLPMINSKIYHEEKMWQCKADILRLEFLWHHGGMYVDADMISIGNKSLDPILELGKETGWVIAYEPDTKDKPYSILGNSVIACTPHHPLTLMLILFLKQTFYQKRNVVDVFAVTGPVMYTKCLVDCNMPISIAPQELLYPAFHFVPNPDAIDYSHFPKCLMFQFGYTCSGLEGYVKRRNRCKAAHTCPFHAKKRPLDSVRRLPRISDTELCATVPIALTYLKTFTESSPGSSCVLPLEDGVATLVTDGDLMQYQRLRDELPGFVDRLRNQAWDVMLFGLEWSTGSDECVFFNVPPGGRPRNSVIFGMLVNVERARDKDLLRRTLAACISDKGLDAGPLFSAADRLSLWFAAEKLVGSPEEARIWKAMPVVHKIFSQIAQHDPPMHFDEHELHGNLAKGKLNGRMAFEMTVESNGAIMFRAWNDDNSPNCEMKTNGSKVEWMKVFFNHQVSFEAQGKEIPE